VKITSYFFIKKVEIFFENAVSILQQKFNGRENKPKAFHPVPPPKLMNGYNQQQQHLGNSFNKKSFTKRSFLPKKILIKLFNRALLF
jgi:hypothetical protein